MQRQACFVRASCLRVFVVAFYTDRMKIVVCVFVGLVVASTAHAQNAPAVGMVDTPGVKVLTGLTVPEFEAEMQTMTQALGVSCGFCHARGNFAAETNPRKATARRMLEMTKGINQQFFPDYKPADGESRLGRVTCFTCHQGAERPKSSGDR
jgi:Photosynthetic reaction centre cytochrome C subunit